MPNGHDIEPALWNQISEELSAIDPVIESVGQVVHGHVTKDYHGGPSRIITYESSDGVTRSLHVSAILYDSNTLELLPQHQYGFAVAAYLDTVNGRRSWHKIVSRLQTLPMEHDVRTMLNEMRALVDSVTEADLALG